MVASKPGSVLGLTKPPTNEFERNMDSMLAEYVTLRQSAATAHVGPTYKDVREDTGGRHGLLGWEHAEHPHVPGGDPHNKAIPIQYILPTSPGKLSFVDQIGSIQEMFEGRN